MIVKFKLFEGTYPKEDPKGIYTIGDRVIITNGPLKGREGTIISFYVSDSGGLNEALVKIEDVTGIRNSGHLTNGDNNEDPEKKSYYATYDKIELVEPNLPVKVRWYKKGKFLDEGIKWYSKGKFEKDDSFEDNKESENPIFKVGDLVRGENLFFWFAKINSRMSTVRDEGYWNKNLRTTRARVESVDYCDNVDGYTGQVIQLEEPYWPWFQTTGFEKI